MLPHQGRHTSTNSLPLPFLLLATDAAASSSSHTFHPRNFLSVLRDLVDTRLYPTPLHTDVGRICTASDDHFWSSMLYDRKPIFSTAPALASRIPDSWHNQRQNRYICVLWREFQRQRKVFIYCAISINSSVTRNSRSKNAEM